MIKTVSSTEKQLAVVTGASSGIGFELAKQFAENGFDLIIVSNIDAIIGAAERLRVLGTTVQEIQSDLSSFAGVDELYRFILSQGRPVDAIAINAGVGVGGAFVDTSLEDEFKMIDLNVKSVVHLSKHIINDMVKRNSGKVLFTASVVSEVPTPFQAVYSATKGFVLNFAESIRSELKDTNITITALMPGATETNFFHRAGLDNTKIGQSKKDDPADVARDGFNALMKGDDKVVAHSLKSKALGMMGSVLSDTANANAMYDLNKPGSAAK